MTSSDLAKPETTTETIVKRAAIKRKKNISKGGSVHENVEIRTNIQMKFSINLTNE